MSDSGRDNKDAPGSHPGSTYNHGDGGACGGTAGPHNSNIVNKIDSRLDSNQENQDREKVAASTTFMPQAGKPAGIYDPKADKPDQRVDKDPDTRRRENVAGSSRFYPQAGKPAGNSSL